jgi:hypothetical protein
VSDKFAADSSLFHPGELDVQRRMGVDQKIAPFAARAIRPFLIEQHREFFQALPFVILTARDEGGAPVLTSLSGASGLMQSPSPDALTVNTLPWPDDPLFEQIKVDSEVGILGIELHTRRRNRANGVVSRASENDFEVRVVQSYGNCKRYITERSLVPAERTSGDSETNELLSARAISLIEQADAFFVGSGTEGFGLDSSHRGGPVGFVRVTSPRSLSFPDYSGNNFYNTVGNLTRDPRIGLLFIDFVEGDLLHVQGRAEIDWDAPSVGELPGVTRWIHVDVAKMIFRKRAWGLTAS